MTTAPESIHVLHVDDEADVAELAAEFLEREDERLAVDTVTSASDGLDILADTDYDCIVSDYDMPRQDGIDFLEAVRERHPELPFILYTGKGTETIASDAINAGVTDYLQKESGTDQYTVLANRITNSVTQSRDSQKIERARERQKRQREALVELSTNDAVTSGDFESAVRRITETAADLMNVPRVNIWLIEDDAGETMLSCVDHYDRATEEHTSGMEMATQEHPAYYEALESHRAIDASDAREDPRTAELTDDYLAVQDIDALLDATLRSEGETIGVVCHEHVDGPREWTDDEIDFASDVADIVHRALRNQKQNQREQTLRETTEQLQAVLDTVEAAIFIKDTEGRYQLMNQESRELLEVDPERNIVGLTDFDIFPDDIAAQYKADDQRVLEHEETIEIEEEMPASEGTLINLTRKSPFYNRDGDLRGICAVSTRITEQKERERALQQERDRRTALFQNFQAAIAYYEFEDGKPVTKEINAGFEETFGISQESATGQVLDDITVPKEATDEGSAINEQVADGELVDSNVVRKTDDELRTFNLRSVPLEPGTSGERGFAIYSDITDRNEREQELERYQTLVKTVGDPMYVLDSNGVISMVNEAAIDHWGYKREEFLDTHAREIMPDEDYKRGTDLIKEILTSEGPQWRSYEMRSITSDGETVVNENKIGVLTDDGEFVGSVGIVRDISKRKEREQELERYETLVEATGDQMYMLNEEGHFTYVNDALIETTGYSEEALLGEHVSKAMEEVHVERGEQLIESLLSSGENRGTFEMDIETAAGDHIPTENHLSLLYSDGKFHGTLGVLRDITDRLERERQLKRERDRLDEFASVVSHDLRNPLNVADGRLNLAMEECESEHLDGVAQALERMQTLIIDMLSLARAGEAVGETAAVELPDLVEASWQTVETASAGLVVDTEMTIQADRTRLQQLLENLMRNAIEHGGEEVTITIGDLSDGFYVEDDGLGIPDEHQRSIFDAGYSTTEDGTGFGLRIVQEIAEAHGWEISVTDGGVGGARFEVTGAQMGG